jgi:hypothetical protein
MSGATLAQIAQHKRKWPSRIPRKIVHVFRKPVESERESLTHVAHDDVKNPASGFRAHGHHSATILQHRDCRKSVRVRWHQQDSRMEEARCADYWNFADARTFQPWQA